MLSLIMAKDGPSSLLRERVDLSYPSFTLMSTTLTHYGKAATIISLLFY